MEAEALLKAQQSLVDFFCEDDVTFKLEEACNIFHSFNVRFQKAVEVCITIQSSQMVVSISIMWPI